MPSRRDAVVILARGVGRRMGGPKFGLKLPGDSRNFLERILDLYRGREWPVTVVVGPGMGSRVANPGGRVRILEGPAGGDTALTMVTAWKADELAFAPPTHFWAHPVDLPLVAPETVERLASVSRQNPGAIVRPAFGGTIGHPVILPREIMQGLAGAPFHLEGPLRHYLDQPGASGAGRELILEETPDHGVVRDFDDLEDLESWQGPGRSVEDRDG